MNTRFYTVNRVPPQVRTDVQAILPAVPLGRQAAVQACPYGKRAYAQAPAFVVIHHVLVSQPECGINLHSLYARWYLHMRCVGRVQLAPSIPFGQGSGGGLFLVPCIGYVEAVPDSILRS